MCEVFENRSDYSQAPETREISKSTFSQESIRFSSLISAENFSQVPRALVRLSYKGFSIATKNRILRICFLFVFSFKTEKITSSRSSGLE